MSKIEWTGQTWNPIVGCSVVSPGCTNCYAMTQAARIERMSPDLGHYQGLTQTSKAGPVWTGKVALAGDDKLLEPLRRRRPTTYFVNSMSDLFHENVPEEWIDRVFAVMALCRQHTFQILTKRAKRMREYCSDPRTIRRVYEEVCDVTMTLDCKVLLIAPGTTPSFAPETVARNELVYLDRWPLPNVWLGVSAEDQKRADERVPELLATPAAVRFVSAEPLLGPIDFEPLWGERAFYVGDKVSGYIDHEPCIDWIIVGGESGPNARPMNIAWALAIRDQCRDAGVRCFVKQLGARPFGHDDAPMGLRHKKGADMSEWPADLRIREIPDQRRPNANPQLRNTFG